MERRDFLIGSTTGVAAVISKSRRVAAAQPRPNVLLIIADDQGVNLAHELSFPIAGDVAASPSWKAIIASDARLGKRSLNAYLHRPAEELYDIGNDPDQLINVAGSADYRDTLRQMREGVREWRTATKDPWLAGQTSPFEHSH
jgi:arylsulfatase A-like enzyme